MLRKNRTTTAIVARWFTEFWGKTWNPGIVDGTSDARA